MGWLRIVLAVSVLIAHAGPVFGIRLYNGDLAVMIFYVISGFYMQVIANKYVSGRWKWRDFYVSRFLRIYPVYWAVLVATIAIPFVLGVSPSRFGLTAYWAKYFDALQPAAALFLIVSNAIIIGQEWTLVFSIGSQGTDFVLAPMQGLPLWMFLPVGQAWSLSLELMFYLLVPLLSRLSTGKMLCLLGATVILHLLVYRYASDIYASGPHRFFPTALRFFLLGMIAARIYRTVAPWKLSDKTCKWILFVTYAIHLILARYSLEAAAWAITLALPFLFEISRNSELDKKLGEHSYSIYLAHLAVWYALNPIVLKQLGAAVLIVTIIFALALEKLLINRIEAMRRKFGAGRSSDLVGRTEVGGGVLLPVGEAGANQVRD